MAKKPFWILGLHRKPNSHHITIQVSSSEYVPRYGERIQILAASENQEKLEELAQAKKDTLHRWWGDSSCLSEEGFMISAERFTEILHRLKNLPELEMFDARQLPF